MTKMTDAAIVRHIDRSGTKVKAFRDASDNFVQAVALVDDEGNIQNDDNPVEIRMDNQATTVAFNKILKELKIMNMHLALMNNQIINGADIDG